MPMRGGSPGGDSVGVPLLDCGVPGSLFSACHVDIPESVRVTVKVTPWHPVGAVERSFTRLGMDWVTLVA